MTTRSASRSRHGARAGFTLIELMAALVAGLIAIAAVYTLGAASSRHFQEQQRVATTQTSLRMAMEQIRADIERAGLYGIASTGAGGSSIVPPSGFTIQAIAAVPSTSVSEAIVDPTRTNLSKADGIQLVGNYTTTGSYLVSGVRAGGVVAFQASWQSFRRDFGVLNDPASVQFPYSADAFEAAFSMAGTGVTRVLHLVTPQNAHFFPTIVSAAGDAIPPTITVQGLTIGAANPRATGFLEGSIAAPLTRIDYAIVDANTDPNLVALRGTTGGSQVAEGTTHPVLVRRELAFDSNNVIPNTTRVVLEYPAELKIDYVIDLAKTTPTTVAPVNLVYQPSSNAITLAPWQVRAVVVRLSARTPLADPRFAFTSRANGDLPLTSFQVAANVPGAAHVRTLVSEIRTPNNR